jgi:hypothetical protein
VLEREEQVGLNKENNYEYSQHDKDIKDTNQIIPSDCGCGNTSNTLVEKSTMSQSRTQYIHAIGKIVPRFPRKDLEKEYYQIMHGLETKGKLDNEIMSSIFSDENYKYIAYEMCWVFTIEGLEIYILRANNREAFEQFVESTNASPTVNDINVVIGTKGPLSSPELCNGLILPVVTVDKVYSIDKDSLLKVIPRNTGEDEKTFNDTSGELFNRIIQMADNLGATDEHRALNYLSVRYDAIYAHSYKMNLDDFSLTAIDVLPSRLSGTRKIVDVIFTYRNRQTDFIDKYFMRVDINEKYPFLVSPLSAYYNR